MKTRHLTFAAALVAAMTALSSDASVFAATPAAATGGTAPNPGQSVATATLAPGVSEVLKLYKAGLPMDVMTNYINNAMLSFYLRADDIVYLQQQGLPTQVMTAMIERDGVLRRQTAVTAQASQMQAAAGQSVQIPAQAPAPTYYPDTASAPAYDYSTPGYYDSYYYNYPYYPYYWPSVYLGLGWGGYWHGGRYYYNGGHVGGFGGGAGHVGGFAGTVHTGGVGHVGGFSGGHAGGFSGGGHGGGRR